MDMALTKGRSARHHRDGRIPRNFHHAPLTGQALALCPTLVNYRPDPVINIGYVTVSIAFVISALYCVFFLVKENVPRRQSQRGDPLFRQEGGRICFKENWKSLIPLCFLIIVVLPLCSTFE